MLDLAVAVFSYASDFFGSDDRPRDLPEVKRGEPKSKADSFLTSSSTIKDLAGAYLDVGKEQQKPAFQVAERRPTRSVSQLTNPRSFQPLGNMRFITGAENADIQNAMRVLANARNNQVAQVIPYSAINYKGGPAPNISVGSTNLASKKIRNDIT